MLRFVECRSMILAAGFEIFLIVVTDVVKGTEYCQPEGCFYAH